MKPPVEAPTSSADVPAGSIPNASSAAASLWPPRLTYGSGASTSTGVVGSTQVARLAVAARGVALADPDLAGQDERLRPRPRLGEPALDEQLVESDLGPADASTVGLTRLSWHSPLHADSPRGRRRCRWRGDRLRAGGHPRHCWRSRRLRLRRVVRGHPAGPRSADDALRRSPATESEAISLPSPAPRSPTAMLSISRTPSAMSGRGARRAMRSSIGRGPSACGSMPACRFASWRPRLARSVAPGQDRGGAGAGEHANADHRSRSRSAPT